ncbi:hypothetical protein THMIRHAS_15310 [Thiosulfatimonas sediminis]|uniref:Methyltransferase FkbM domain-containing protein n=1 Tax=Thiosulfatimonas sediminis TaxID=2675054 RepID=A0A6F8PVX9_9GAMM|nr:hypothetical protein [Thiosulfatimonas sediminis]BBP46158.1 hypothetical protein THMIRHAS_15310 [Thiosulfatimonas sediminis]
MSILITDSGKYATIVYLGAGEFAGPIDANATQWHLIEADPQKADSLEQRFADQLNVQVHPTVVAAQSGAAEWIVYNLDDYSGLYPATGLKTLYPGLREVEKQTVDAQDISQWANNLDIEPESSALLVLNIPSANSQLLTKLMQTGKLQRFNGLLCRQGKESLFTGAQNAEQLVAALAQQGYDLSSQTQDDPDFVTLNFQLNTLFAPLQKAQAQLAQSQAELSEAKKQQEALQNQLAAKNEELKQQTAVLNQKTIDLNEQTVKLKDLNATLNEQAVKLKDQTVILSSTQDLQKDLKNQLAEKDSALIAAEEQLNAKDHQISEISQALQNTKQADQAKTEQIEGLKTQLTMKEEELLQNAGHLDAFRQEQQTFQSSLIEKEQLQQQMFDKFANLEKKIEDNQANTIGLLTQNKQKTEYAERHILDAIKKGLANNILQIEAFENLNNYLNFDSRPLNFHGWPISPDIALFLIEQIEGNDYDLIIEFGSGTSTALFSKVISKQKLKHKGESLKVVTFEHNKVYFEKTKQNLESQFLADNVELTYAPLKEYQFEDQDFLYYDCSKKLMQFAKELPKEAKILILVDGPPGATGPKARFPALPYLLRDLSHCRLDLVLDDYARQEEKDVAKAWEQLLEQRSIRFVSEEEPSEKGLYFCKVN